MEDKGFGKTSLPDYDEEVWKLIKKEKRRQINSIELIASENFVSRAVLEALGSCPTNKYSEGLPGHRYYGGNEVIDEIENLCIKRALEVFQLDAKKWGVNVQPYSGSPANMAVYTALLAPHGRLMGLDLPSGGHLTHGYTRGRTPVSASAQFWTSQGYKVSDKDGLIDYNQLEISAALFHPELIISGSSAYPRDWDYKRLKEIADKEGAKLMCDMAHYSGLVVAKECNDPFEYCDVVTTTTHKTLRGPRAALIFYKIELEKAINKGVFPMLQGGPHENTIAAVAVALKEAKTQQFNEYIIQVKKNAKQLAKSLMELGYKVVTDGTDNHLLLWNVRDSGLTGSKLELLLEKAQISVNKNSIYGDTSAINPGGIRLGSPAMTSRALKENDFVEIAKFLDRGAKIALKIQEKHGKLLKNFVAQLDGDEDIKKLKKDVEEWVSKFPMPGIDKEAQD